MLRLKHPYMVREKEHTHYQWMSLCCKKKAIENFNYKRGNFMKMTNKKTMFWIVLLFALCMATTVQATGENGELAGTWLGVSNLGDSRCVKIEYLGSNTYSIGPSDLIYEGDYILNMAMAGEEVVYWYWYLDKQSGNPQYPYLGWYIDSTEWMIYMNLVPPSSGYYYDFMGSYLVRGTKLKDLTLSLPSDIDANNNGIPDYYFDANQLPLGICEQAVSDADGDGIPDTEDNCPNISNPGQKDSDGDGVGEACDNCPDNANSDQADSDGDGIGEACDLITLTLTPPDPSVTDTVILDVAYTDTSIPDPDIKIYINSVLSKECTAYTCRYEGGPFPDGLAYRVRYKGPAGIDMATPIYFVVNKKNDWDLDGIVNAEDNCPKKYNPNQEDGERHCWYDTRCQCQLCITDGDGIGDACDNCPGMYNSDQADWNNDGIGDACDCNDNFMGPNEEGADCGGICTPSCIETIWYPWNIAKPVPVILSGDPKDKIDVVFVMDEDYKGDINKFRKDIMYLIQQGYFGAGEISSSKCKWNFWYSTYEGDYVSPCIKWNLDSNTLLGATFADGFGIVCSTPIASCAAGSGTRFATEKGYPETAVHESGHAMFNLADEYCCAGGYFAFNHPTGGHNIFKTQADCMAHSVNPAGCYEFCPAKKCWPGTDAEIQNCKNWFLASKWPGLADSECSCQEYAKKYNQDVNQCTSAVASDCPSYWSKYWKSRGVTNTSALTVQSPNWLAWGGVVKLNCGSGWWKSDNDDCRMNGGKLVFYPDCHKRVTYDISLLPDCSQANTAALYARTTSVDPDIVVLLQYRMNNDSITLLNTTIINNEPPNYFLQHGKFLVSGITANGEELYSIFQADPRVFDLPDQKDSDPGMPMANDVTFSVVVPLLNDLRTVEISDTETGEIVHITDLADSILAFCKATNYEDPQCQTSDLDNDLVPDIVDNCPLVVNSNQSDQDGDGMGDACDNCANAYNPDQKDSNDNGIGDACDIKFSGFFAPIDNNNVVNAAKAGQSIPVKWRLTDGNGVPISYPGIFAGLYSYSVKCSDFSGNATDAIEEYTSGAAGLQYLGDGNWQFNWKTLKTYAGQCRDIYIKFAGGTASPIAKFQFK
jgi:hypothetical protein